MAVTPVRPTGGAFRGGVGGSVGLRGEATTADLSKRLAEKRKKDAAIAVRQSSKKPQGFFTQLADDIGLDDFYEQDVLPVVGRVFGSWFEIARKTKGASIPLTAFAPTYVVGTTIKRAFSDEAGKRKIDESVQPVGDAVGEAFDFAQKTVKAGAGIVKTKGWEPAKEFIAPAIDAGTKAMGGAAKDFADTAGGVDDFLSSEAPLYEFSKNWADRNAIQPTKDFAAEVATKITRQPINARISAADDVDRQFIYLSNDISQRGKERESAATASQRERWMRMALGQYSHPAWEGYKSPFTPEQLANMSDYELVNAAYGTHTNSLASFYEALKSDFKKIGAMPAALNLISTQISDADKRGDYRGLGTLVEFMGRQAVSVIMATNQAALYASSGGLVGDYRPLVRALKTEPLLTSLDVLSTATLYGKGATVGLKTGGALSKAGAIASRVPGSVRTGAAIARGAEAAAGVPVVGRPLRIAAATGRGLRRVADVEKVEVYDPRLREVAQSLGYNAADIQPSRVFRPTKSIFSKAASLLRKSLYERSGKVSRQAAASDARAARAIGSMVAEQAPASFQIPISHALTTLYKENPNLVMRVLWDLSTPEELGIPKELAAGEKITFSPGQYANQLEDIVAGKAWLPPDADLKEAIPTFSYTSPGRGWKRIIVDPEKYSDPELIKSSPEFFVLSIDDATALKTNIRVLRQIDELPEEVVTRAKEVLDSPYADVFGSPGRRIGGRDAPDMTLRQLFQQTELGAGAQMGNVERLRRLGVKGGARVYALPPQIDQAVRANLGIPTPDPETAITRRSASLALMARLQDMAIAQAMYQLGPKIRAEIEQSLRTAEDNLQARLATQQQVIEQLLSTLSEAEKGTAEAAAAAKLAQDKIDIEKQALGVVEGNAPAIPMPTPDDAKQLVIAQKSAGLVGKIEKAKNAISNMLGKLVSPAKKADGEVQEQFVATPIEDITNDLASLRAQGAIGGYLDDAVLFGEKYGDATGSNKGENNGFWTGTDGVNRYVKEYIDSPDQALSEYAANVIYRLLGISVPKTTITVREGKVYVATEIVEGAVPLSEFTEIPQTVARRIIDGVVADTLLANWDAVGTNLENILVDEAAGVVYRIDQGGSLAFRAQGQLKPASTLGEADVNDFISKNQFYRRVFDAAGYADASEIPNLRQQLDAVRAVFSSDNDTYSTEQKIYAVVKNVFRGLGDVVGSKLISDTASIIDKRLNSLLSKDATKIDVDLPSPKDAVAALTDTEVLDVGAGILQQYQGNSIFGPFNEYLRYGELPGAQSQRRLRDLMKYAPDYKTFAEKADFYIEVLRRLAEMAPETDKPLVVYRGAKNRQGQTVKQLQVGEEFIDEGWVSTSFDSGVAMTFSANYSPSVAPGSKVVLEVLVPAGSKAIVPKAVESGASNNILGTNAFYGEAELNLPPGTRFVVASPPSTTSNGTMVIQVVAITPGAPDPTDIPTFGKYGPGYSTSLQTSPALQQAQQEFAAAASQAKTASQAAIKAQDALDAARAGVSEIETEIEKIKTLYNDIDLYAESLMRDLLESSDTPSGASVFFPTLDTQMNARKSIFAREAIAGRGRPRTPLSLYTGQFALLGSMEDLEKFSGNLVRSLRAPAVAYEAVSIFTDYLLRTGLHVRFSKDAAKFREQIETMGLAKLLNNNGTINDDYVILPIDPKTGFLKQDTMRRLDTASLESVGTKGRSDVGVDDAEIARLLDEAISQNNIDNWNKIPRGASVVIIQRSRFDALRREFEAAAKDPTRMRRLTRFWVRVTLTTLPRTPIANVLGSALLSGLGGGLGGYPEAARMLRRGKVPPELLNNGFGGMFDEGGTLVVPSQKQRFALAQKYMNFMYYYNVMGEDFARLSVFMQQVKKDLPNTAMARQIDAELAEAADVQAAFQKLLEAVATGKFANGQKITPELEEIRTQALQKADDFLGGARGLTSQQRLLTTYVPFWMWYKHIFKLYFYTLPFKYPGRSLTLNAMARLGAEESRRQGYYDTFWEDGIKVGEEVRGPNIYSKALTTNIFPFTFGGVFESQEGAPGAAYLLSNIAPTITTPLRMAGVGIPGQPLLGPSGKRLGEDQFFTSERGEVALSEFERLFAPVGLAQRYLTPRGSLILGAGRLATGREIPQAEPRGEGPSYAVTPRGVSGIGAGSAALEALARAFGVSIERVPVEGPVARRRLRQEEQRQRQRVLEEYKKRRKEQRQR